MINLSEASTKRTKRRARTKTRRNHRPSRALRKDRGRGYTRSRTGNRFNKSRLTGGVEMTVYEIADINRNTGKQEADSLRIGRRYCMGILEKGTRAVLPHVDDQTKALVTSPVTDIKRSDNGKRLYLPRSIQRTHNTKGGR